MAGMFVGTITQELHRRLKQKSLALLQGFDLLGSPTRARTWDLRINSIRAGVYRGF